MIKKIKASVGILTLNNEKTIKRCLDSVRNFDEIIISDGGSTDATLIIAQKFNCKIIKQFSVNGIKDFAKERNKLIKESKHQWFFIIDSDESVSTALLKKVRQIVNRNIPGIYFSQFKVYFNKNLIKYYSSYPGKRVCLIHKSFNLNFSRAIHEKFDLKNIQPKFLNQPFYLYWDQQFINDFWIRVKRDIQIEVNRSKNYNFKQKINIFVFQLKVAAGRSVRVIYYFVTKPKRERMPLIIELYRILYSFVLIYKVLIQ